MIQNVQWKFDGASPIFWFSIDLRQVLVSLLFAHRLGMIRGNDPAKGSCSIKLSSEQEAVIGGGYRRLFKEQANGGEREHQQPW